MKLYLILHLRLASLTHTSILETLNPFHYIFANSKLLYHDYPPKNDHFSDASASAAPQVLTDIIMQLFSVLLEK